MSKFIPLDATGDRLLGSGLVTWNWRMPWACMGCRRYGDIGVKVAMNNRSTNDEIRDAVDRDHFRLSRTCPAGNRDILLGRIFRMKNGGKIYLRKKDERADEVKEQVWPPWLKTEGAAKS